MTRSGSLENSLNNAFIPDEVLAHRSMLDLETSIIVKSIYGRSFVPCVCVPSVYNHLLSDVTNRDIIVYLPRHNTVIKKTAESIIKELFLPNWRLSVTPFKYINTTKGYGYYGSKGLILSDTYEPLLVCGYEVEATQGSYNYTHAVCFISPSVFTNDDIVSKCIVKKVIPYYSSKVLCNNRHDGNNKCYSDGRIRIIISSDINDFIHRPVTPLSINVDDEIYNILSSTSIGT